MEDIRTLAELTATRRASAAHRQRALVRARWLAAAFAAFQVATYTELPYPDGVQEAGFGLVALLLAANVVMARLVRDDELAGDRRLGAAALTIDTVAASGFVMLYAFDPVSAIFLVLVLIPIEGAVFFGQRGAGGSYGVVCALYLVREWLGTVFGDPWEWDSVTFRLGLLGLVAFIVGSIVRQLEEQQHEAAVAMVELRRADAWRQRLVSMLAHDVRAPLAGARTSLTTLRDLGDDLTPDMTATVVNSGVRQADRGLLLARDLLDMARSESGVFELETGEVDVAGLVEDVRALSSGRGQVTTDVTPGLTLVGDRARLEQVMHNLVENGLRYGEAPVVITGRAVGGAVELRVRDHGAGIPDGVEMFTPFSGVGTGGVGLGVWLVRQLVEAHGGRIHHEHADPGAVFVVRLPGASVDTREPVSPGRR